MSLQRVIRTSMAHKSLTKAHEFQIIGACVLLSAFQFFLFSACLKFAEVLKDKSETFYGTKTIFQLPVCLSFSIQVRHCNNSLQKKAAVYCRFYEQQLVFVRWNIGRASDLQAQISVFCQNSLQSFVIVFIHWGTFGTVSKSEMTVAGISVRDTTEKTHIFLFLPLNTHTHTQYTVNTGCVSSPDAEKKNTSELFSLKVNVQAHTYACWSNGCAHICALLVCPQVVYNS